MRRVDKGWLGDRLGERPETPDGRDGKVRITHEVVPAGRKVTVVSMRNGLFMGQQPTDASFVSDLKIRHLEYEGGEWMADSPQEVWQMHDPLELIRQQVSEEGRCRVLVGGLGLGVFSHLASEYAGGTVTTIEKDPRIISLVAEHSSGSVFLDDLYEYAARLGPDCYDFAFLDTWQATGEYAWVREVVPARRLVGAAIPKVMCWNEDEMIGQVWLGGFRAMLIDHDRLPELDIHRHTLRHHAVRDGIVSQAIAPDAESVSRLFEAESELRNNPDAEALLRRLTTDAGSEVWEEEFGQTWDIYEAYAAEKKQKPKRKRKEAAK